MHSVIETHIAKLEGRYDEAIEGTLATEATFDERGLSVMVTAPRSERATILLEAGRLEEARAAFEALIAYERELGLAAFLSTTLIDYGCTLYALGDLDAAARLADEGEAMGGPEDVINFAKGGGLRAQIAADRGDDATAQALGRSAADHAYRTDFPETQIGAHEVLAHVHRAAGRASEARGQYEQALAIAKLYGHAAHAQRIADMLAELRP